MLDDRERLVLHTIIKEYIQNSEPVASGNVSKAGPLKMSSATIRNIMGVLENKGYLLQPHTSSGRIPTDRGFRYYVDHLVVIDKENDNIGDKVNESMQFTSSNISVMMQEFSKRLGVLTQSIGFVAVAKKDMNYVKHIEFTRLNRKSVLAVLINKSGFIQNVMVPLRDDVKENDLVSISNYLNQNLKSGSIQKILNNVKNELKDCKTEVIKILEEILQSECVEENVGIYLDGASNILNMPDFTDISTLKAILRTLDEKRKLSEILESCMQNEGVQIFVGSEIGLDIEELGLVGSTYGRKDGILGMVGVIGPKRMEYSKMISVVNYSSQLIEKMIKQIHGGYCE